jgi:hypothetical protein
MAASPTLWKRVASSWNSLMSRELPKGKIGPLDQLVEQRTFNPWVDGSSPSGPIICSVSSRGNFSMLKSFGIPKLDLAEKNLIIR